MRELDYFNNKPVDPQTQIQKEQEKKFELVLEQTIHPHQGHKLFEINMITGEVKEAEYDLKQDWIFQIGWKKGDPIASQKALLKRDNCIYISALNKKAALKKLNNGQNGSKFAQKGTIKFF